MSQRKIDCDRFGVGDELVVDACGHVGGYRVDKPRQPTASPDGIRIGTGVRAPGILSKIVVIENHANCSKYRFSATRAQGIVRCLDQGVSRSLRIDGYEIRQRF
jgi:hypothetical protein